jgi:hypothetical protein
MTNRSDKPETDPPPGHGPHEEFLALCALSTAGDLTEAERKTLEVHLAECSDCRQALKEFEAAADLGMPLLHEQLSPAASPATTEVRTELQEPSDKDAAAQGPRDGSRRAGTSWSYLWVPFAAGLVLTVALSIYAFQFGRQKGRESIPPVWKNSAAQVEKLEQHLSDAGHEREILRAKLAESERRIADLERLRNGEAMALNETRKLQGDAEQALRDAEAAKQQMAQERANLSKQLETTQSSLAKSQADLQALRRERAGDQSSYESLEAQILDLHSQLREREQELAKQEELLAHDRDIRELMGARDLYIAEVYDVAKDGQTQKPYGRVFYTKGKSLIFYAYDLDQQPGARNASTFQAWGRRGGDKQQALNLGIFYQDSAAKKRWILKFEDPQALASIDGVFVTIEPKGGSQKPSGRALLFASLKIDPNHP